MIGRIMRVIRLDWTVFREIAADPKALSEAAIIVAVSSFLSAIGSAAWSGSFFVNFSAHWIDAILISWLAWAVITYFVGTRLFGGKTDIPEMLRVLGYASAPNALGFFGVIPLLGWTGVVVGAILALIAGVLAVREAMEFDTGKAIVTAIIGWVIALVIRLVLFAVL